MSKDHRLLKLFPFLSQWKLLYSEKGLWIRMWTLPKRANPPLCSLGCVGVAVLLRGRVCRQHRPRVLRREPMATPTATWLKPAAITQAHTYWGTLVKTTRNGLGSLGWRPWRAPSFQFTVVHYLKTFTFRALSRSFYPKCLIISTFVLF